MINGVRSIKTDIYYRLGWLKFAASLIKRNGRGITAGPTRSTFKKKPQVSFSVLSPHGLADPRSRFIYISFHCFHTFKLGIIVFW